MSHRVTSLDQKSPRGLHKTRRCGSGREHIERCDRKKPPRPVTWRAKTEREGFEPPSPFGRSLSRRVQYHSASAPNSKARLPEGRPGGSLRASSSNRVFESGRYQKTAASGGTTNRGARIRTGDLCDPNAALYRTEPRPGTNSGQSMYGRVELTSLRSVVSRKCLPGHLPTHFCRSTRTHLVIFCEDHVGSNAFGYQSTDGVGFEPTRA